MESILIVDDSEENRYLLECTLTEMGYRVESAADGQDAVRAAFAARPDLILLDVLMPKLSGYEVCDILKRDERTCDIPVIFLSAMCGAKDKIRGLEAGGVDYITKPFDYGEIIARVQVHLKIRRLSREIMEANRELTEKQRRLDEDLIAAAGIQQTLLPQKLPVLRNMEVAWKFMPSDVIGGDIFNIIRLNEDYLAIYMLDVSGHGVPSALVTVSVSQVLQPHSEGILKKKTLSPPYYRILRPREVLRFLDREYPVERFKKFFTMIYAVVHIGEGRLTYSSAGHPQPILLHPDGDLEFLEKGGPIIGLGRSIPFEEEKRTLRPGDILIFYTDGVIEFQNAEGVFYGMDRFCELLKEHIHLPVARILDTVIDHLLEFGKGSKLRDDVSLLGFQYKGGGKHGIRGQVHHRSPGRQTPG